MESTLLHGWFGFADNPLLLHELSVPHKHICEAETATAPRDKQLHSCVFCRVEEHVQAFLALQLTRCLWPLQMCCRSFLL